MTRLTVKPFHWIWTGRLQSISNTNGSIVSAGDVAIVTTTPYVAGSAIYEPLGDLICDRSYKLSLQR
jgi:hypothetical protein